MLLDALNDFFCLLQTNIFHLLWGINSDFVKTKFPKGYVAQGEVGERRKILFC